MLRGLGVCVLTVTLAACSSTSPRPQPSTSARLPSLPSYTDAPTAEHATCAQFQTFLDRLEAADPQSDRQSLEDAAVEMHLSAARAQSLDQNNTYAEQLASVSAMIVAWVDGASLSQTVTDPPLSTMGALCR